MVNNSYVVGLLDNINPFIKSLKDINKGWEIKMDENGEKRLKEYKDNKALIIGVIGNFL
jgi:hypothetical protein